MAGDHLPPSFEPQPRYAPDTFEAPPRYAPDTSEAPPRRQTRRWVPWVLLLLTFVTTTLVGMNHFAGFIVDFVPRPLVFTTTWDLVRGGLWYSLSILAILGAHELGHFYACKYYRVDCTPPFFMPFLSLTGTLGAFIRIRGAIRTKPVLFDIGVAGPIAGFVVAVPLMLWGLAMSRVVKLPANFVGLELGEPLMFQLASRLIWGPIPDGFSLNLHPMAFASWFGLLATALNLFPIGQLDGGHISYSVFGRRSLWITIGAVGMAVLLTFHSLSWMVWTVLMVVMLAMFGPRHPPTLDEHVPLDRGRTLVAGFALLMFIACFTPAPIQPYELIRPITPAAGVNEGRKVERDVAQPMEGDAPLTRPATIALRQTPADTYHHP